MNVETLRRAANWRTHVARRLLFARSLPGVTRTDTSLVSSAGYPISARIVRPLEAGVLPGLVVSPAIHHGRNTLDTWESVVTAGELAALGYVVLTHDPSGRGASWGEEDFGGPEQQDNLVTAVEHLRARPDVRTVGVLSLSFGVVAASAALTRVEGVRWLVDWEGPSDREVVTTGGTRLVPADGHALDDEEYWRPREAVRHLPLLKCGYVRLQAWPDHAQPLELRHAERMIHAAKGAAWLQLNDHPRGVLPPRPDWLAAGPWAANRAILRKLSDLR